MLILTNGLTEVVDEGFLKVANSLIKRVKAKKPDAYVVSYERRSSVTDRYLEINKLLLNRELISLVREHEDGVLYVPFPAKTLATALRVFILSLYSKVKPNVILVMKSRFGFIARVLLKLSGARITVLSEEAGRFYCSFLPERRVKVIKCGVDTQRFSPVDPKRVGDLKTKYGFDADRPLILHVGHLKQGRNVSQLLKIAPEYQVLLVTSTLTKDEQETELREKLLSAPNVRVIDEYIPNIEEIYQMSDAYFFPTVEECNCIDVPLSCLEAAACGKPVITSDYGEMRELAGRSGFYRLVSFDEQTINDVIRQALSTTDADPVTHVLEYDWDNAVNELLE